MTLTKMECPNCHGTLHIPEGMKEGFVTCEYCKTKVYIEPSKPNITQSSGGIRKCFGGIKWQ